MQTKTLTADEIFAALPVDYPHPFSELETDFEGDEVDYWDYLRYFTYLDIPVVADLDAKVAEVVYSNPERLQMASWHTAKLVETSRFGGSKIAYRASSTTNPEEWLALGESCNTTHCRAGWAVHLAGEAGYNLERGVGPGVAGALIYLASTGHIPDFYASNEDAMKSILKAASERENNVTT